MQNRDWLRIEFLRGLPKGVWDDNLLDLVEWLWDTLDTLDTLESSGSTEPLVTEHTTDDTHEHIYKEKKEIRLTEPVRAFPRP